MGFILFNPRVLANEKPVFSGCQGSPKVLRVMNLVADGDNYTKVGFFYEPREVILPLCNVI